MSHRENGDILIPRGMEVSNRDVHLQVSVTPNLDVIPRVVMGPNCGGLPRVLVGPNRTVLPRIRLTQTLTSCRG